MTGLGELDGGANRVPISGFVLKWPGAKPLAPLTRRGAGAVERGGLENRCPPCGGPRVRIPPSPQGFDFIAKLDQ